MPYREVINKVFEDYFYSNLLPSTYGGFSGSTMVQLLSALNRVHDKVRLDANIDKVWYDGQTVTWYTPQLHKLIQLPRFNDDTDQDFLDRIKDFQDAQEFGGQSEKSIRTVLVGLMSDAIQDTNIAFFFVEDTADLWNGSETWDGTAAWQDLDTILDVDFMVQITFTRSGFDTDKYAWEYWNLEANLSKIEDLIKLFKPVGSEFIIQLVAPPSFRRYQLSTARIKILNEFVHQTSNTTIKVIGYGDPMMASQTAIQHLGYFYGDLEYYQTINIVSTLNVEAGGDPGDTGKHTYTKLYGSFTTIVAP